MDAKLQAALDLITAALQGALPTTADDNWLVPQGTMPTVALDAATADEGELKRYAVWGFKADLTRGVAPQDFPAMVKLAEGILKAPNYTAADAVIANAGTFPPEVAAYLVLTGCTQGFSSFLTPSIFAPAKIQTVRDAALYAVRRWTGGAGPGL